MAAPSLLGPKNAQGYLSGVIKRGKGAEGQLFLNLSQLTALRRHGPYQQSQGRNFKWTSGGNTASLKRNTGKQCPAEDNL